MPLSFTYDTNLIDTAWFRSQAFFPQHHTSVIAIGYKNPTAASTVKQLSSLLKNSLSEGISCYLVREDVLLHHLVRAGVWKSLMLEMVQDLMYHNKNESQIKVWEHEEVRNFWSWAAHLAYGSNNLPLGQHLWGKMEHRIMQSWTLTRQLTQQQQILCCYKQCFDYFRGEGGKREGSKQIEGGQGERDGGCDGEERYGDWDIEWECTVFAG